MPTIDEFIERRERLAREPESQAQRYRRFFYQLDFESSPQCVEQAPGISATCASERKRRIESVRAALGTRLIERAKAYEAAPDQPPAVSRTLDAGEIIAISKLLRGVIEQHFADAGGRIDIDDVQTAFEMFANGRLRLPRYAVSEFEADSGLYFLFAELAFAAVEAGVDTDLWVPLAGVLTRSQEIFMLAYPPSGPRSALATITGKFRPSDFTAPILDRRIGIIRARYAGMTHVELQLQAARNAYGALRFGAPV